jgi:hypothetical protein
MSDYENHEHDEDGNCVFPEMTLPSVRFSGWNLAGIAASTVGGFFSALSQGLGLTAQQCWNHARWVDDRLEELRQWEIEEANRAEISEHIERLSGMDSLWLADGPAPEDRS